jgi:hypothetical protein
VIGLFPGIMLPTILNFFELFLFKSLVSLEQTAKPSNAVLLAEG